jgi:hypothetical protein
MNHWRVNCGHLACGALLWLSVNSTPSFAGMTVSPTMEQLSPSEKLEAGVIQATAIVVGRVRRIVRGLAPNPAGTGYIADNYVTISPSRWLKGSWAADSVRVGFWGATIEGVRARGPGAKDQAVWFLYPTPQPTAADTGGYWAHPTTPEWMALESDDVPGGGFIYVDAIQQTQLEADISRILQEQTPSRMVQEADVVAVGVVAPAKHSVRKDGALRRYASLHILETIKGNVNGKSVYIRQRGTYSTFEVGDTLLSFLKHEDKDEYEVIRLGAGAKRISRGRLRPSGESVREVIDELSVATKRRAQ